MGRLRVSWTYRVFLTGVVCTTCSSLFQHTPRRHALCQISRAMHRAMRNRRRRAVRQVRSWRSRTRRLKTEDAGGGTWSACFAAQTHTHLSSTHRERLYVVVSNQDIRPHRIAPGAPAAAVQPQFKCTLPSRLNECKSKFNSPIPLRICYHTHVAGCACFPRLLSHNVDNSTTPEK